MEPYRYQQLAYLVVPMTLGVEFFINARQERMRGPETSIGSYALDFFGIVFTALVPALFIFTIWAITAGAFDFERLTLARMDRYGVLFLFLGAWWQVYMIGALRAARMERDANPWYALGPTLGLGLFISFLVLWVSPFGLKWISVVWFLVLTLPLAFLKATPKLIQRVLWVMAGITFLFMNLLFIWLKAII